MGYSKFLDVAVTPTLDTDAYTADDVLGGLLTFSLSGFVTNGGLLNKVQLVDDDDVGAALKLYLFRDTPTSIANDANFAPSPADLKLLITDPIAFSSYTSVNSNSFVFEKDINDSFSTTTGAIYGYLVCDATPTFTASALTVTLSILSEQ